MLINDTALLTVIELPQEVTTTIFISQIIAIMLSVFNYNFLNIVHTSFIVFFLHSICYFIHTYINCRTTSWNVHVWRDRNQYVELCYVMLLENIRGKSPISTSWRKLINCLNKVILYSSTNCNSLGCNINGL